MIYKLEIEINDQKEIVSINSNFPKDVYSGKLDSVIVLKISLILKQILDKLEKNII